MSKQYQRELHNASIAYKIPMNVLAQYAEASMSEKRKKLFITSIYNVIIEEIEEINTRIYALTNSIFLLRK